MNVLHEYENVEIVSEWVVGSDYIGVIDLF